MLGDVIDGSRNGRRQYHAGLEHRHLRRRTDRNGRLADWSRKLAEDPWLLACLVLSGLAFCATAAWLILAIFHSPTRFLSILEAQGIGGLWEVAVQFWQRLL